MNMGTIDEALKRRKAISQEQITHRAILEPETTRQAPKPRQNRKRVTNGIRNTKQR
jgi:hypothetical protein